MCSALREAFNTLHKPKIQSVFDWPEHPSCQKGMARV